MFFMLAPPSGLLIVQVRPMNASGQRGGPAGRPAAAG
jgi:hypothetical protein